MTQTHHYQADPDPDARTLREADHPCTCGMPVANAVHKVPAVPAHVRDTESRWLGEHEGDQ